MQRDISIWQRAEDIWQEAHRSAAEQRRIREAQRGVEHAPSWAARVSRWVAAGQRRRALRKAAGTLAVLAVLSASSGAVEAATSAQQIRSLAENILGRDTVRVVRLADQGTTAVIVWASPTYRRSQALEVTRELLYAEAALTVGAVTGVLQDLRVVRFTIVGDGRVLARGETSRVLSLVVAFEAALGGGTYAATRAPGRLVAPGSTREGQEL
jgi:hypothetical protein